MSMMMSGKISAKAVYYCLPIQAIGTFHVPLFFVCSGFLYQLKKTDYTFKSHGKSVAWKLLELGVPYFVFSLATLLIKMLFASEVNNQATPILKTLFIAPTGSFWFLYALFFLFCFIPRMKTKRGVIVTFCVSFVVRIVFMAIPWGIALPDVIRETANNAIWFSFGMLLTAIDIKRYLAAKIMGGVSLIAAIALSIIFYRVPYSNKWISFLVSASYVYGFILLFMMIEEKCSRRVVDVTTQYFMPVYLMHTIFAAGVRILLDKLGIGHLAVHAVAGLTVSFVLPALVYLVAKQWWVLTFVFEPKRALAMRAKSKAQKSQKLEEKEEEK